MPIYINLYVGFKIKLKIKLVIFLKWKHVGFKIDIFSGIFEMSICEL